MKAIAISTTGDVDVLQSVTVETPPIGLNDVLVNVKAVSVNPVELKIRKGVWAGGEVKPGTISGFDFAGTIAALGSGVPSSLFTEGDEVYGLGSTIPTRSNAEYLVVDWRVLAKKPVTASFEHAAAWPLVGLTAWEMIVEELEVKKGNGALLVINGAGGVGSALIQIAKHYLGIETIIATASRPETIKHVRELGATHTISHRERLAPQIEALGLKEPINYIVVLTSSAADLIEQVIDVAALRAKIGLAVQGTPDAYSGFGKAQRKSLSFHWEFVFTKMIYNHEIDSYSKALSEMAKLYDAGLFKSIVTQRFDLTVEGLRKAHIVIDEGATHGKVVLGVPSTGAFE
ncbi:hypothetical protein M422DRAFT_70942 [Sphaerobolus stellatus SS14]|uniref:Unplaced genomic scaffold SPHSTscaffold_180, whole genome shotgun sequence n=1 Tax=Sphaerobolus stellatus (strain SS14) TaxID=990650 RepID=A0A0C9UZ78_SPHS4|nr:hypothetical protein M422DRAFT_70942 [Sphaerobolus stellatus SS14]